jgi:hypothetical protein
MDDAGTTGDQTRTEADEVDQAPAEALIEIDQPAEAPVVNDADADAEPGEADTDADAAEPDAGAEGAPLSGDEPEEGLDAAPQLTLDEMVAELTAPAEPVSPSAEPAEAPEPVEEPAEGAEALPAPQAVPPSTVTPGPDETLAPAEVVRPVADRLWTRIPFWVLGLVWAGLVGASAYALWPTSAEAFILSPLYPVFIFGAAALVAVGVVLGLIVWLTARSRAGEYGTAGVGRRIWTRALGWTAGGVALWWIALIVLDLHRTGVIR